MNRVCQQFDIGFLIYDSRSGSTMFADLLNNHSEVVVSFETEFLLSALSYRERYGELPGGEVLYRMLLEDKRLADWGTAGGGVLNACKADIAALTVHRVLVLMWEQLTAAGKGKRQARLLIIKQGLLSGHMDSLLSVWPRALIFHIYRDGRAVFASKKKSRNIDTGLPMAVDPARSARRWVRIQTGMRSLSQETAMCEIQYERLVSDTDGVLSRVWQFLGLEPKSPSVQEGASAYARGLPSAQRGIHSLVGKPPDRSRILAWRTNLSAKEIYTYERIAGALLLERGYPLTFSSLPGVLSYLAFRIRTTLFPHSP